jgi:hypothetical protein
MLSTFRFLVSNLRYMIPIVRANVSITHVVITFNVSTCCGLFPTGMMLLVMLVDRHDVGMTMQKSPSRKLADLSFKTDVSFGPS